MQIKLPDLSQLSAHNYYHPFGQRIEHAMQAN